MLNHLNERNSIDFVIDCIGCQNQALFLCLFDRHCPYVLEAITALAEMGASAKDIISLFPQVCW